jgi:hypothetical protein
MLLNEEETILKPLQERRSKMENRKINDMCELYNKLQEKWWELKHDNTASIEGVKGYEHVDVAANYYKMQALEEVMEMIEA